jgi:small-conductance mechanosensitive channel
MDYQAIMQMFRDYDYLGALAIIVIFYIIGQIAKLIIRSVVRHITKKTKTTLDDELLHALEPPILWLITIIGLFVALFTLPALDAHSVKLVIAAKVVGILWGCWTAIRVVRALFNWYGTEMASLTTSDMDDKYLHIFRRVVNIIIIAIVGMLILQSLGVAISPLIAGLGIGGLAIGLALQDTLANFFSGFYLISDRAVKIGDYVEIAAPSGTVKGHVQDIGWRTSKIKTLADNQVIVPNSSFANSTVINYQAPTSELSITVPVGVSYEADLDKVEKITMEVIVDTLAKSDANVPGSKPLVRFTDFGASSVNFIAILRINDPAKEGLIKHDFIMKLKRRFDKEKIEIPFPITTVHLKK